MPFPGVLKCLIHIHEMFREDHAFAFGYCVLISVEGIESLGEYFRLIRRSNDVVMPFELKCININGMETELSTRVAENSDFVSSTEILEQHDKIVSNQTFSQTSRKRII